MLDTGRPTGLGIASGSDYYLPLGSFGKSKEPEVCIIDTIRGAVKGHLKTSKKDAFGNLLFYDGRLLSQTATDMKRLRRR